jgi:hypothetical protein
METRAVRYNGLVLIGTSRRRLSHQMPGGAAADGGPGGKFPSVWIEECWALGLTPPEIVAESEPETKGPLSKGWPRGALMRECGVCS